MFADCVREEIPQALFDREVGECCALGGDALRGGLEIVRDDEADAIGREVRRGAPGREGRS